MVKHQAIAYDYCISAGNRCQQQKKRHPEKGKKQSWMPKDGSAEGATSTDADIISITIGLVNNKKRAPDERGAHTKGVHGDYIPTTL